ncbi:alpha/beta hydrolase [Microbacterium memoriense]|uniref:Alpha/beta hydrolase n=1 Tax=Microbacterium memoriense TaxID=2978350 RepID=A0ABT2PDR6_9MICO|nr:alpha/beta hydrolase [Microbacterium memoriense]MCT9002760.1 alpha/beta hydrolase [Microbacterium memoriense]
MPPKRRRRVLRWIFGILGGLVIAAVVGILVWSQVGVMAAEPEPLAAVRTDDRITITDDSAGIVMAPSAGESDVGLVFIPGAKVDPWGYAATLSGLVADDEMTVVITKPWLNLAFFDLRGLSSFTDLAPGVTTWMVGGHSLGGVRSCQLAADADALVLFASYCATDVSSTDLPVLSLSGSEDGLSTPEKIAEARHLLPADAEMVEIPGASHASFGAYGPQAGDGTPTATAADVDAIITEQIGDLAAQLR